MYNIHINTCLTDAITGRTKKFFKLPGWILLFILLGSFYYCLIDNLNIRSADCRIISIPVIVCEVRYYISICYTGIVLFWIYLVAVSIMMITKTHTRLIRCLLKNIDIDTQIIVAIGNQFMNQDFSEPAEPAEHSQQDSINKVGERKEPNVQNKKNFSANDIETDLELNKKRLEDILQQEAFKACQVCWTRLNANIVLSINCETSHNHSSRKSLLKSVNNCKHFMSSNHILHFYSRILYLLRVTSILLQRWISSFILWTLIW